MTGYFVPYVVGGGLPMFKDLDHDLRLGELLAQRIERDAARKRDGSIDYVAWSRRIRAMTPRDVPQTDSLAMLREDRDR